MSSCGQPPAKEQTMPTPFTFTSPIAASDELFSRERLAGHDPAVLERTVVAVIGAGAAGNNIALNLALLGVGEIRLVDDDVIDPSNLTRSPGFAMVHSSVGASKASVLARAIARLHPRSDARVRYANARIEALGFGALVGATVVVSAVDSKQARAYLADATRLLGIPMVEVGFRYPNAHVAVFGNREHGSPCWRCREPEARGERASCSLYARRVVSAGRTPATQPLAAVVGAFAAEACVRLAHREHALDDTFVDIDLRTLQAETMRLASADRCPGVHRRPAKPTPVALDHTASAAQLLAAVRPFVESPALELREPYVTTGPCVHCGARVHVGALSSAVREAPRCRTCPAGTRAPAPLVIVSEVDEQSPARRTSLRRLGYVPGDVVAVRDGVFGSLRLFVLQGSAERLFRAVAVREGVTGSRSALMKD
jgi:molybdopterin/thiamine biosynthesis adenylyltransferase